MTRAPLKSNNFIGRCPCDWYTGIVFGVKQRTPMCSTLT